MTLGFTNISQTSLPMSQWACRKLLQLKNTALCWNCFEKDTDFANTVNQTI